MTAAKVGVTAALVGFIKWHSNSSHGPKNQNIFSAVNCTKKERAIPFRIRMPIILNTEQQIGTYLASLNYLQRRTKGLLKQVTAFMLNELRHGKSDQLATVYRQSHSKNETISCVNILESNEKLSNQTLQVFHNQTIVVLET